MTSTTLVTPATTSARLGSEAVTFPSSQLGELRDANALISDLPALRQRMDEDGYLLIRGFHHREDVLAARREILQCYAEQDRLDPTAPVDDAIIATVKIPTDTTLQHPKDLKEPKSCPAFQHLVRTPRIMGFFDAYFNTPALTYDFQWLRTVGNGDFTGPHVDNVYMGRGSHRVLTTWTPIGDVSLDLGTLAIAVQSHTMPGLAKVRDTYGKVDVDRDRADGWFSNNPLALAQQYGLQWATTEFKAGDALIFGMYTMHTSLTNTSNRFRLSCDTRYQPANEPTDDRWVGKHHTGHTFLGKEKGTPMSELRKQWGV